MPILLFKALHLIFMVTWFAGLFYLVRLFVYHREAESKPSPIKEAFQEQYAVMERRLYYIITWPGMVLTVIFGTLMIIANPAVLDLWLYIKLGMVLLLIIYHVYCGELMKDLKEGKCTLKPFHFRLLNEGPTLLLFGIITLAVYKNLSDFLAVFGGLVGLGIVLFLAARLYKSFREKRGE
jgi:protoporphyrinogen IX oxidase